MLRLFFAIAVLSCGSVSAAPIQIMPLGDSITDGYPTDGGYRGPLYQSLTAINANFQFVGSATDHPFIPVVPTQVHHEGHSGFMINQIANNLTGNDGSGGNNGGFWINPSVQPNIVLLLIGDADFNNGNDPVHAINRLEALVNQLTTLLPNSHIIVSNLAMRTDSATIDNEITTEYNPFIPGMVAADDAAGKLVSFIDLHSVIGPNDLYDGLHLNAIGYQKLAYLWTAAILPILVPEPSSFALLGSGIIFLGLLLTRHVSSARLPPVSGTGSARRPDVFLTITHTSGRCFKLRVHK